MTIINLQQLLESKLPNNGRFYTIAIDGRGGSGKSMLLEHLRRNHPAWTYFEGDDYFEPVQGEVVWGRFNDERFSDEVIEPLKIGATFTHHKYDWHRPSEAVSVTVEKVFCLERCYTFEFDLNWDLKIWVETPKELCRERGLSRETMPREQVLAAWREVWQPMEDDYIERVRPLQIADIVLDGTKPFADQIS